jgi:hypothetical protein
LFGCLVLAWTALGPPRAQPSAGAPDLGRHASEQPHESDFACRDHACGCADAEQCRSACCCAGHEARDVPTEVANRPARFIDPVEELARPRATDSVDALRCHGRSQGHAAASGSGTIACVAVRAEVAGADADAAPWRTGVTRTPKSERPDPATPPPRAELPSV